MSASDALVQRIRAEFTDLPGLKLTVAQARRLCSTSAADCLDALNALAREGFLRQTPSGAFIALPRPMGRSVKVLPSTRPSRCPSCHHLNSVTIEHSVTSRDATTRFRCVACGAIVSISAQSA